MNAGERILQVVCEIERDGLYDPSGGVWARTIASRVYRGQSVDGRRVTALLRRLEDAGLVERHPARLTEPFWISTERGREVDAIRAETCAERGGRFVPMAQAGISPAECHALQRGGTV